MLLCARLCFLAPTGSGVLLRGRAACGALLLALLSLLTTQLAQAQSSPSAGPPSAPQLRIEAGMHTATINLKPAVAPPWRSDS